MLDEAIQSAGAEFSKWVTDDPDDFRAMNPLPVSFGIRLVEIRPDGYAKVSFRLGESHMNPWGGAHGGATATLLDTAAGVACCAMVGSAFRGTLNLNLSFLAPVQPGEHLVEARVVGHTRSHLFIEAELNGADGEPVARASVVAVYARARAAA